MVAEPLFLSSPSPLRRHVGCRLRLLVSAVVVVAMVAGCGGTSPLGPGSGLVTISGVVYEREMASSGEPLLVNALIVVNEASGPPLQALTDTRGFYTVSVRAGAVSISVSKEGYATRDLAFEVAGNTVLNFSLTPTSEQPPTDPVPLAWLM
jgi:hypothetical protein